MSGGGDRNITTSEPGQGTEPDETEIPAPSVEPGNRANDDHALGGGGAGLETRPPDGLDPGVGSEHLRSSSQGARPEEAGDVVAAEDDAGVPVEPGETEAGRP